MVYKGIIDNVRFLGQVKYFESVLLYKFESIIFHIIIGFSKINKSCNILFFYHRDDNGQFEPLELTQYSAPPDLPDVMKSQESNGQEQQP